MHRPAHPSSAGLAVAVWNVASKGAVGVNACPAAATAVRVPVGKGTPRRVDIVLIILAWPGVARPCACAGLGPRRRKGG